MTLSEISAFLPGWLVTPLDDGSIEARDPNYRNNGLAVHGSAALAENGYPEVVLRAFALTAALDLARCVVHNKPFPENHPGLTGLAAPRTASPPKTRAARDRAVSLGYSGDTCTNCFSLNMKRAGSCMVCESCGQTTGCS